MCVHPAPAPMLWPIVEHVASLAERRELVQRTVAGIMIEVCAGQYNRRPSPLQQNVLRRPSHASTLTVAPVTPVPVPPSPIPQMEYLLLMRAPAMLAAPPCPHEAHMVRKLRPIDWVQEHVFGSDRHQASPSKA